MSATGVVKGRETGALGLADPILEGLLRVDELAILPPDRSKQRCVRAAAARQIEEVDVGRLPVAQLPEREERRRPIRGAGHHEQARQLVPQPQPQGRAGGRAVNVGTGAPGGGEVFLAEEGHGGGAHGGAPRPDFALPARSDVIQRTRTVRGDPVRGDPLLDVQGQCPRRPLGVAKDDPVVREVGRRGRDGEGGRESVCMCV